MLPEDLLGCVLSEEVSGSMTTVTDAETKEHFTSSSVWSGL